MTHAEFSAKCRAIMYRHGIEGIEQTRLASLYEEFSNAYLDDSNPSSWCLRPDEYEGFLEGWEIGHRRMRRWVTEKRAGSSVRLTRKAAALFAEFEALASAEAV